MSLSGGPVLYDRIKCIYHPFGEKTQFSVGRSTDSTLDIVSKVISRSQCLIKLTEEKEWAITDLSSFRSTRVNRKPVMTEWQVLLNGDKITFINFKESEFVFYKELNNSTMNKKRKLSEPILEISDDINIENNPLPNPEIEDLKRKNNKLLEEIERLTEENKNLNDKYQKISSILEQTQKSLEETEVEKTALALKHMEEQTTKERLLIQLQNYIDSLKECEMELERIVEEKVQLQQQLVEREKPSNENNNASEIFVEFNTMKEDLEKLHKELLAKEAKLNEITAEKDILCSNISDLLEQEFTCSVCSDVLFQATTLDCRHTFCAKCVATWKLKKKECPVCRSRIKNEIMPLVIDSFIDKVTELIGGEFKTRRDEIREELASNRPSGAAASHRSAQTARRGQRRQSRGNARQSNRRHGNMLLRAAEYEIIVNHLQRLVDAAEPLVTIDLTDSPGRNRR